MKGTAAPGEKEASSGEQAPGSCLCGPAQLGWEAQCGHRVGARLFCPPLGPLQYPVFAPGPVFQPYCPHAKTRAAHTRDIECGPCCPTQAAAAASFSVVTWCLRVYGLGTGAVGHLQPWPLPAAVGTGAGERAGCPHVGQGRNATQGAHRLQEKTPSAQQKRMGPKLHVTWV